ncbi:hypothetical protein L596_028164 [Steinernema carpocapsae]|uniref:J domain-containing protein n=1 Tax=Steinernema carpocapsae TaxID=34508 RepID=A0A4U5LXM2_STECR|nr:hypothetical protein L596_028164 [Steinernema carpocapsae]
MSLLADLQKHFECSNLYEVLHLDPKNKATYSAEAIKKAYYKQSLKFHPDRLPAEVTEDEKRVATEKFQAISGVYAILGDEEKRKIYDETGVVNSEDWGEDNANWDRIWRSAYKKVTIEEIEKYLETYGGSEEEREDVKEAYERSKGNRNQILERVIGSDREGAADRIFEMIQEMIDEGKLKKYSIFSRAPKKLNKKRVEKEAKEAEKMLKEISAKGNAEADLASMILARQQKRVAASSSFLDNLVAKYGDAGSSKAKKRKTSSK